METGIYLFYHHEDAISLAVEDEWPHEALANARALLSR
jgi:hypothetical protein